MKICRHCRKAVAHRPRGLCWVCYYMPEIRELYPSGNKAANNREPTMAELDAMIAEQMQCLPRWWRKDVRRQRRLEQ